MHYLLRGIKRTQGNRHTRPPRRPITITHLKSILHWLRRSTIPVNDRRLWWSACTLAFFGLLRVSEYTCVTTTVFHQGQTLSVDDISFNSNHSGMAINIKASKTDPFRLGCVLNIGRTNNPLCPVHALRVYLSSRPPHQSSPLFIFNNHSFLTRSRMSTFITNTLSDINLNTHSFRIGGATALAAAGVSNSIIQIIGRWSSDCFLRYLRLSPPTIYKYATAMCNHDVGSTCWTFSKF